ncbi:hypothetical protein CLV72_102335 [Allonocardiopsis opalescens]|uniref:Uncharacterized protein n=1 Tax=Allonocardiopsis opalescens TaxID=1144618 RepID=A0A2T0QA27_9ACTN|nr:hypothetical protein CLV72_102335 [Allonocardiopsis opalescens]
MRPIVPRTRVPRSGPAHRGCRGLRPASMGEVGGRSPATGRVPARSHSRMQCGPAVEPGSCPGSFCPFQLATDPIGHTAGHTARPTGHATPGRGRGWTGVRSERSRRLRPSRSLGSPSRCQSHLFLPRSPIHRPRKDHTVANSPVRPHRPAISDGTCAAGWYRCGFAPPAAPIRPIRSHNAVQSTDRHRIGRPSRFSASGASAAARRSGRVTAAPYLRHRPRPRHSMRRRPRRARRRRRSVRAGPRPWRSRSRRPDGR